MQSPILSKIVLETENLIMSIKILGMILTVVSSSLIGMYYGASFKKRTTDLNTLKKAVLLLKSEINYSISPLPQAFENISTRISREFGLFFKSVADELNHNTGRTLSEVWKRKATHLLENTYLNSADIKSVMTFSENIGYLDKDTQCNTIQLLVDYIDQEVKISADKDIKYLKLYRSLGVLGGILIIIIFI